MKKLIVIGLGAILFTGCYSCREAMELNYDSCMMSRNDKAFCMKVAEMEARDAGYCMTSSVVVNYHW